MFWLTVPLGAPLPLLMQSVEASGTQQGWASAAWQLAMLAQLPAAIWISRMRSRKRLWAVVNTVHRLTWFVPALLPVWLPSRPDLWPWLIIASFAAGNFLANVGTVAWQSWMADLVPETSAGRFWNRRQLPLGFCLVAATLLYGVLLDRAEGLGKPLKGFQWVFGICAVCGVLDIWVHLLVHEPEHVPEEQKVSVYERLRCALHLPGFVTLTGAMALWTGAQAMLGYNLGLPGFFSMVHLKEDHGVGYTFAAMIFAGAGLGTVVLSPWLGKWMDRYGADRVFRFLAVAAPFTLMLWWFPGTGYTELWGGVHVPRAIVWMSAASVLQGAVLGGAVLCHFRMAQMVTRPEGRTVAMGLHWCLVGVLASFGSVFAGWLSDRLRGAVLPFGWKPFDLLVVVEALLVWFGVRPLLNRFDRHFRATSRVEDGGRLLGGGGESH
jgi:MFS family permease